MPTILTPQGWVKVNPPARKRVVTQDPKVALRGPLAYLACQQSRSPNIPMPNIKGKSPFPYDLSASPEKLKRQNHNNAQRTVSAPVMHGALHPSDDEEEPDYDIEDRKSRSEKPRPKKPPQQDDAGSVASSSSNSSSTASSSKSYTRHRPVDSHARPRPPPAPRQYYSAPRYDHYPPPPVHMPMPMPMPMPPTSGRSLTYSWYNATTPLNIG
jgi:hypothetical protein